eukprot:6191780-Pleurochrysis_carterae.AAC.2
MVVRGRWGACKRVWASECGLLALYSPTHVPLCACVAVQVSLRACVIVRALHTSNETIGGARASARRGASSQRLVNLAPEIGEIRASQVEDAQLRREAQRVAQPAHTHTRSRSHDAHAHAHEHAHEHAHAHAR